MKTLIAILAFAAFLAWNAFLAISQILPGQGL
jgi:hypothetical protein